MGFEEEAGKRLSSKCIGYLEGRSESCWHGIHGFVSPVTVPQCWFQSPMSKQLRGYPVPFFSATGAFLFVLSEQAFVP